MPLNAVLFDLDGTLLDTSGDLACALNALLQQEGRPALPLEQIRPQVSNGAKALVHLGFGEALQEAEFNRLRAGLLAFYAANIATHTRPFNGIETLLQQLHQHGLKWGIATNKPWQYTQALLNEQPLQPPPQVVICPNHVPNAKPAPDMLLLACQQLNCPPSQALYIGDHERDITCGRAAGLRTLAVGYGYTQHPQEHTQWGADFVVAQAADIWAVVRGLL